MKASFDGARQNLATAYTGLLDYPILTHQQVPLRRLREAIAALLCMYDPSTMPADGNDLSKLASKMPNPYAASKCEAKP